MAEERPYTIDQARLSQCYEQIPADEIEEEVELMKIASTKELFELIATNCYKYISIIENYKKENLQTLFNISIRRIEGHLLIKFKLNANDRWVEVGFFDDNNTDKETMDELKRMITYYLKNYDEIGKQRRTHIASQFDDDLAPSTNPSKQAVPDNYFDPKENPELEISMRQKESAGYAPIPEHLKGVPNQIKNSFNLSTPIGAEPQVDQPNEIKVPTTESTVPSVNDSLQQFKRQMKQQLKPSTIPDGKIKEQIANIIQSGDKRSFDRMNRDMNKQGYLLELFSMCLDLLDNTPVEQHPYIYQFLTEIIGHQSSIAMVGMIIELSRRSRVVSQLTSNQKQIIQRYDIKIKDLVN